MAVLLDSQDVFKAIMVWPRSGDAMGGARLQGRRSIEVRGNPFSG